MASLGHIRLIYHLFLESSVNVMYALSFNGYFKH